MLALLVQMELEVSVAMAEWGSNHPSVVPLYFMQVVEEVAHMRAAPLVALVVLAGEATQTPHVPMRALAPQIVGVGAEGLLE